MRDISTENNYSSIHTRIDIFLQEEISKRPTSLLAELYTRKNFSNVELLYLFSNNKLKRNGLPMKRGGKKKAQLRHMIHSQHLFNIIEDVFDDVFADRFQNKEFFQEFVDIKDICRDENCYSPKNQILEIDKLGRSIEYEEDKNNNCFLNFNPYRFYPGSLFFQINSITGLASKDMVPEQKRDDGDVSSS